MLHHVPQTPLVGIRELVGSHLYAADDFGGAREIAEPHERLRIVQVDVRILLVVAKRLFKGFARRSGVPFCQQDAPQRIEDGRLRVVGGQRAARQRFRLFQLVELEFGARLIVHREDVIGVGM